LTSFTETLTNWYRAHKRALPWRETKDPYPIWLSEIILQQTRVEQGLPYWERFMEAFPKVADLANASESEVLRLWQGLGYYSRARNLHTSAKIIHEKFNDVFPNTYSHILQLKGIGPYTAAAIASICFDEKTPVVDGNVFRFAARYFGIEIDIASSSARKSFEEILLNYIPAEFPGEFNQAMMEFGAKLCAPSPDCEHCPFSLTCYANGKKLQKSLPIKTKKVKVKDRFLHYLVITHENKLYMNLREGKDVWKGLYDFYLIEGNLTEEEVLAEANRILPPFVIEDITPKMKHILSHQRLNATFYEISIKKPLSDSVIQKKEINAFSKEEILNLPKPKLIVNYLSQRGIN